MKYWEAVATLPRPDRTSSTAIERKPGRDDVMAHPRIATGMYAPPNLPMSDIRMLTAMGRLYRLDSLFVYDHFQDFYPTALWDQDFTWAARRV